MGAIHSKPSKQSGLEIIMSSLDDFQRNHNWLAKPYAVFKKFSDDGGGHLAALITYYGFLSLFPLLIVATAFAQIIAQGNIAIRDKIISGVTSYFPAVGDSLAASLHTPSKSAFAVALGLIVALYGARGVADSIQNSLNVVWAVPRKKRSGFPVSTIRSIGIIVAGGLGSIMAAILSGYATNSSLPYHLKIVVGTVGFIMLFAVFWGVFSFGSSAPKRVRANIPGALMAAFGLQLLQAAGNYLILNQLSRYTGLNAQFAIVLVLLFWIYLQVQVFLLSLEYNTVRAYRLYPRSIDEKDPTAADKKAHKLYGSRDSYEAQDC